MMASAEFVTSGVCEMRTNLLSANALNWQLPEPLPGTEELLARMREQRGAVERDGPCFKRVEPSDPLEGFPFMQQMALVRMLSAHGRGVSKKIMAAEGAQDTPSMADHVALRERGLCIKAEDEDYHQLTYPGIDTAKVVLQALCRKHAIHYLVDSFVAGQTTYRCICGGWSKTYNGRGGYVWRRATNDFYKHLPAEAKVESA